MQNLAPFATGFAIVPPTIQDFYVLWEHAHKFAEQHTQSFCVPDFFHQTVPGRVLDVVFTVHRIPFVLIGHVSGAKVPGTGCEPFGVLRHVVVALFAPCCQQRRRPRRCSELRFGYYQACSMVLEAFDGFLHGRAAWQFHGFCYGYGWKKCKKTALCYRQGHCGTSTLVFSAAMDGYKHDMHGH